MIDPCWSPDFASRTIERDPCEQFAGFATGSPWPGRASGDRGVKGAVPLDGVENSATGAGPIATRLVASRTPTTASGAATDQRRTRELDGWRMNFKE
jgi:hypothetical protein